MLILNIKIYNKIYYIIKVIIQAYNKLFLFKKKINKK
jgi:hypothetical protein